ncbi:MAG: hypothetical protein ACRCR6_04610 [Plesiomonas sp.]
MRVSNGMMSGNLLQSIQLGNKNYNEMAAKMSTNNRLLRPSDDFIASRQVLELDQQQAGINTYLKNITKLEASLSGASTQLQSMQPVLDRMTEIGVHIGSTAPTLEEREAYATELATLQDTLVSMFNGTSATGNNMFSGNKTGTMPVARDEYGMWRYQGDNGIRPVPVADGVYLDSALSAGNMLNVSTAGELELFSSMDAAINALRDPAVADLSAISQGFVANVKDASQGVNIAQTRLGGDLNTIEALKTTHEDITLFNKELKGGLTNVDYSKASIEINETMIALQAVQKTFAQVSNLNLFSII